MAFLEHGGEGGADSFHSVLIRTIFGKFPMTELLEPRFRRFAHGSMPITAHPEIARLAENGALSEHNSEG